MRHASKLGAVVSLRLEEDAVIDRLAQDLCMALSLYDPVGEPPWGELPEDRRDLYRSCIKYVLARRVLLTALLRQDQQARLLDLGIAKLREAQKLLGEIGRRLKERKGERKVA